MHKQGHQLIRRILAACCAAGLACVAPLAGAHSWESADQMSAAAEALLASLEPDQRKAVQFAMDAPERSSWSNLPVLMVQPPGVMLNTLNDTQRQAVQALLRASLSSQGYAKFTGIMRLETVLREQAEQRWNELPAEEQNPLRRAMIRARGPDNYAVAIFGTPGSPAWGWKIAGHHAAANFTVADGQVAFTPTFLGSSPRVIQAGPLAGTMALPQEGDRGIELMQALAPEQQATATLADEVAQGIFEGPGRRGSLAGYEGLNAAELNPVQLRLLNVLIEEYVRNADFDSADAQLAAIREAGMDQLWFSWRGPVDPAGVFYYRVHGPRLLIEYNRQNENHDHSIVRDPRNDYGDDWFGQHLQEHHPSQEEIRADVQRRFGSEQDN